MSDVSPAPRPPSVQRSTLRDLAPWAVLALVVMAGVVARSLGADVAIYQLLGTVAGVCGGYVAGRKSGDGPTVTTTSGDPTQTEVKS